VGGKNRQEGSLTGRSLAEGSVRIDFDYKPDEGLPFSAHRRLREAGPVLWSDTLGGWLVSSYEGVRTVLSDLTRFTSEGTPIAAAAGAEAMLVTDSPLHNALRAVWAKQVSKAAIAARQEELEENAAAVLDRARSELQGGATVDFVPVFRRFVMSFIASSFAIPPDRLEVFEFWSRLSADTPALELAAGSEAQLQHLAAKNRVMDLVREQVGARRENLRSGVPCEDFIGLMVAAEGQPGISPSVAVDNIFNFILGAMDTTEKWLGNILVRLFGNLQLLEQVREDRRLIDPLINEVMRADTVAQVIQRRVRQNDAQLGGVRMKAGDQIFLMLGAANHDPAEFENAGTFDIRRLQKLNFGFGFGFHHCLGLNIARQEACAFMSVLLDKLPNLRVAGCDYGNSWALWGPRALHMSIATP
jgi:cytochrome P450